MVVMVPNIGISASAIVLQDESQPDIQCTEACSVMIMLVKVPFRQHEVPELLIAQCEIQQEPCLEEDS